MCTQEEAERTAALLPWEHGGSAWSQTLAELLNAFNTHLQAELRWHTHIQKQNPEIQLQFTFLKSQSYYTH